ncbi:hypothetical protein QN277_022524 [Acacia crassicarpa]|uniref:Thioesterase domain-containing protein n=1 Tax=Acacia crassicarpa TaxID=499986 RepID=A0AAE1JH07_9FABA|nr:hypothetical protein QN277_022524 [Acacia crassicarpa]
MEESKAQERVEQWIRRSSKGEIGHEAEVEATKDLRLLKIHKGFVLCDFLIHYGVSDESGKRHEGAMATLLDIIGSLTAFSFTAHEQTTVSLSVSCYSKPNLQEVVEIEGKAMAEQGRMTSVRVEVRTKHDRQIVALGIMWMAHAPPKNAAPQINKSISPKL